MMRASPTTLAVELMAAALVAVPHALSPYYRSLTLGVLADVTLAVAWAFFSGPTRYLSLATGAFFGLGAYLTAMMGARLPWPLPVAAGAGFAALMALLVGLLALRLRGPYFAVFTFGLAELAKHILIWYEMRVTGTVGRLLLAPPSPVAIYYTVLALAALAVATAMLLRRSPWGDALIAIGADEERAQTLGIDTTTVKIGSFALSAAFMGAVGAAMAPRWTYIDPQVFNPLVSFQTVIMAMVGGATTIAGPIVGAVFIGLASEILLLKFRYLYMLALGLVLIAVVMLFPRGLVALGRRRGRARAPGLAG
jgi:branched-chain amino acid transport system permease protein